MSQEKYKYRVNSKYQLFDNKVFISLDDMNMDELKDGDQIFILDTEECRSILSTNFNDSSFIINLFNKFNSYWGYVRNSTEYSRFKYSIKIYVPSRGDWYYYPSKYCFKQVSISPTDLYKSKKIEEGSKYKVIDDNILIPITKDNIDTLNEYTKIYIEDSYDNKTYTSRKCGFNTDMEQLFGTVCKFKTYEYTQYPSSYPDDLYDIIIIDNEDRTWYFPGKICYIYKSSTDLYKPRKKLNEGSKYIIIDNKLLVPITEEDLPKLNSEDKIFIVDSRENRNFTSNQCGLNTKMTKLFGKSHKFYSYCRGRNSTTDKYHINIWDDIDDTNWEFPASICYFLKKDISDIYKPRKKSNED